MLTYSSFVKFYFATCYYLLVVLFEYNGNKDVNLLLLVQPDTTQHIREESNSSVSSHEDRALALCVRAVFFDTLRRVWLQQQKKIHLSPVTRATLHQLIVSGVHPCSTTLLHCT